jgi:exosortase
MEKRHLIRNFPALRWSSALPAIVSAATLSLFIALLYWEILHKLARDWLTIPSLSHGPLIPLLAAWIAIRRRDRISALPAGPDARGLLIVAASCALLLFGTLAAEFFLARISFVLLLAGLVWTFWGAARLRALRFPFLLLATMVPLPGLVYNALAFPLQLFATMVSARLAEMLGITLYVDGNIIHLAGISLGIDEACSGLSSLSALFIGGLVFGRMECSTTACRLLLGLLAFPAAVATNIIRVTGTAVLADYNSDYAMGFYHGFSGWLVFVLGSTALYGAGLLLHKWEQRA